MTVDASETVAGLARLRTELERVDRALVAGLAERYHLAREVGRVKLAAGVTVVDPAQEASVLRRAGCLARAAGLGEEEVRHIFWCIIDLSRGAQLEIEG